MNMLMMVLHDQKIMPENYILQNVYHEIALMVEIPSTWNNCYRLIIIINYLTNILNVLH
jgi:hypothetical protein